MGQAEILTPGIAARRDAQGIALIRPSHDYRTLGISLAAETNLDTAYHYIVRYWIAPGAETRVIAWLDGKHTAEMVALPGFLSGRRVRLEEKDAMGWQAFCTIYAVESKAAVDSYFASPIRDRFAQEIAAFAGVMRVERLRGAVEWRSA